MPLIKNQKGLYTYAVRNNFIMLASHMCGLSTMKAILQAAEEEKSPIIVQIGKPTYAIFQPFSKFIPYFRDVCADYSVPILLNHDHNPSVQDCIWALDQGFPSVMFDGSHLPFEENVAGTREVVAHAHKRGAWVEAELGSIPGFEDMVIGPENTEYTNPQKAVEFVERTGCDSLAVAVGTAHGGVRGESPLSVDFDLLGRIRDAIGPDYPLVLHGAASLPKAFIKEVNRYGGKAEQLMMCTEETIEKTRHYGVAKANMDVDNQLVITGAVRRFLMEKPEVYAQVRYINAARDALQAEIRRKMRDVTKSAGYGPGFHE